jgi:hypothetical protein
MAQLEQLSLDAPVAQDGLFRAISRTSAFTAGHVDGRPSALRVEVYVPATNRQCQDNTRASQPAG